MIKRILTIAMLGTALINAGCSNSSGGFKKVHGIEYNIVTHGTGKKAAVGDVVQFNFVAKVDTLELGNSYKMGHPGGGRVDSTNRPGDLMAVLPYVSVGDSLLVRVWCDTLIKNTPKEAMGQLPPWMKKGKFITVNMKIVSVQSLEDYRKEMDAKRAEMMKQMQEKAAAQMPIDDKILQDYFTKHNLKPTKTASGLYYSITKEGKGDNIKAGEMVSMRYTGKTLDGKTFDSNEDSSFHHPEAFTFPVGRGQVIKGWDEGVQLLKKGSKAVFYIPSPLAYGPQEQPNLPANSILMFDVTVEDVKAAPAPKGPGMAPAPQQEPAK